MSRIHTCRKLGFPAPEEQALLTDSTLSPTPPPHPRAVLGLPQWLPKASSAPRLSAELGVSLHLPLSS